MRVKWETLGGTKYEGEIIEVDSNVLIVRLDDGQIKAVEDSGVIPVDEVKITNKNLSVINANKSMQFDCPNCRYNLIEKSLVNDKFTHNYCPHCGVKLIWNLGM